MNRKELRISDKEIKIWLDDLRPAPEGYIWCRSVNQAIQVIRQVEGKIELIDCDHDLGDYSGDGGDGIKLLDWLAEKGLFYKIKIHTMNPVGRMNMERMLKRYWTQY